MRFRPILLAASALLLAACGAEPATEDYAAFVNPKIGTGGHGHVFVGANVPFGFVQLGPTSIPQSWDWCSGYHDSDRTVIGFSHTHLSGTGIGDLFDITVMPTTGPTAPARGTENDPQSGAWSYADRSKEICEPGYYSVPLERYKITAEMTATTRVGFHRYTFPATDNANLVFDLENGGCWDDVTDAGFEVVKDEAGHVKALGGYRFSTGWAKNQKVFFWAEFSRPSVEFSVAENPNNDSERKRVRKPIYGYYNLGKVEEGAQVLVKVALSPVSIEGAKANMAAELPGWDFEETKAAARQAWNEELSRVAVTCSDPDTKTVFYTALYHTMVAPSIFDDVDGQYRGSDDVVRKGNFRNYTTFSLWDTYRITTILGLASMIAFGLLSDKLKTRRKIAIMSFVAGAVAFVVLGVVPANMIWLYVVLWGTLPRSISGMTSATATDIAELPSDVPIINSVRSTIAQVGSIVIGILMGYGIQYLGYQAMVFILAGGMLIGAVLWFFAKQVK